MNTESTIATENVPRVGELRIVRVVDFEKIAAASPDGRIAVADLTNAGDFVVVITPTGRGAVERRVECDEATDARAFVAGFVACATLKARTPKTPAEKAEAKKKREAARAAKAAASVAPKPANAPKGK